MPDEASTPPADTQAPPPQSGDTATGQASEPVTPPATEPVAIAVSPETAQPEIAPTSEAPQTESAPEAPSGAVEASGGSENLEAVIDTTPQNTPVAPEPRTAQTAPGQSTATVIRPHGDLALANAKIQATKRKKLDKIMAAIEGKGPTTLKLRRVNAITNDEVEKLLRVSDATATRYLDALEKEGRVRQEGKTGKGVVYIKI